MSNIRFRQVHLDFHTSEQIANIGMDFDPADFAETLQEAGVDSITCFARCHHGMIYYDTKFPARHPHLKRNLLKEQIDACHKVNIKVPIYITVGLDEYSARIHPEWLQRTIEGKQLGAGPFEAGWRVLCFNSPYIGYVEEQTIEVLELFGDDVDGLFFDIISQSPCCCSYCMEGMLREGFDPLIEEERKQYAKKVINAFKDRLSKSIRRYNKDCFIFYNAGHVGPYIRESLSSYSHLELESLPSGGWGYDHFPISVRFARNLGLEYLAMTGKFHKSWADFGGFKNQAALEYECFTALANGAKCSIGDQLHPKGKLNNATYQLIGSVYHQIQSKEQWCDGVSAVVEMAVFTPEAIDKEYKGLHPAIRGAYRMLLEGHYQFDIIDEYIDFNSYKVIVFPDVITFSEELAAKVKDYIKGGGKIILSHKSGLNTSSTAFMPDEMGLEYIGDSEYSPDYIMPGDKVSKGIMKTEYVCYEHGCRVRPRKTTEILGEIWNPYFNRSYQHFSSHYQTPPEKPGEYPAITKNKNVIYLAHPIFSMYNKHGMRVYKQIFVNCLELLLADKMVITNAPTTAQISLNQQQPGNRYIMHILHYIPERRCEAIDIIEDIIPLYQVDVEVKLPKDPQRVYLAPSMEEMKYQWADGYAKLTIPKVVGHEMVVFEMINDH